MVRETVQWKAAGKLSACVQDKAKASESATGETHLAPLDTSCSSVILFCINNTFLQDWGRINMLFIQNRSPTNALTGPNALLIANKTLSWKVWGEKTKTKPHYLLIYAWVIELNNKLNTVSLNLNNPHAKSLSMFLCSVCCLSLSSFQWSYCEKQNKTRHSFRTASPCNL